MLLLPRTSRREHQYSSAVTKLWCKLKKILTYLSIVFVDLFQQHRSGPDPFARFLVSWFESLGKLACQKLSDHNASDLWQQLCQGESTGITDKDRSALVFAIGASCYTFVRKTGENHIGYQTGYMHGHNSFTCTHDNHTSNTLSYIYIMYRPPSPYPSPPPHIYTYTRLHDSQPFAKYMHCTHS